MKLFCDCYGCKNEGTWDQVVGGTILRLCESHHFILRTKVNNNIKIETDKDVLQWLLNQPPNSRKVVKYGIIIIGKRTLGTDFVNIYKNVDKGLVGKGK